MEPLPGRESRPSLSVGPAVGPVLELLERPLPGRESRPSLSAREGLEAATATFLNRCRDASPGPR